MHHPSIMPFHRWPLRLMYRLRQVVALVLGVVSAIGWLTLMAEMGHVILPVTVEPTIAFAHTPLSQASLAATTDSELNPVPLVLTPMMLAWELLSWGSALCLSVVLASYVMRSRRRWLTVVLCGFVASLVAATFLTQPHPVWFMWGSALVLMGCAMFSHKYATKVRYRRCR
jgi:hypothetical protein